MDSRSRFSPIPFLAASRFGGGRARPRAWLAAAAVGFLWLHCVQTRIAASQIPGVAGGGLDALSQPIGPSTPSAARRDEVFDAAALAHTRSFCVDMTNLESGQAAGVREFLAKASQPNKVLDRLPWQLVDDCTKADAVARIYFVRAQSDGASFATSLASAQRGSRPVLLLYDKASVRLFYRAEGQVVHGSAVDALGSPFAMLVKDLKKITGRT